MSRPQRFELLIFIACFFAFAYFNQGGGWNQNARFAEIRAMAEEGRFAIDDFLVYRRNAQGDDLVRLPVQDAEYTIDGKRFRLCWVDMEWNLYPVGEHPLDEGVEKAAMVELCSSGDIGYVDQKHQFHPNKPPGTSFLALPGYFLISHVEKWLGMNLDHWWTLEMNAWLTTVCSVGVISALGCVLFFRLARDFAGGATLPALLATLTFAFGTTFFPFGTILFDHSLTASLLVAAFYFLRPLRAGGAAISARRAFGNTFLAGVFAGLSVLTNYVAIGGVATLGLYALLSSGVPAGKGAGLRKQLAGLRWDAAIGFALGGFGPFLLLCWYNWVCFGAILKAATDFQNPLFKDTSAFLGMFGMPDGYKGALLAFSPFRGLFFFAPVLLMGLYGAVVWLKEKRLAPEARVCLAIFGFFFVVNASFNGYHAGFSAGPRYLVPGIPFLALPLVVAFAQWRRLTSVLALVSIANHLLMTATDAQNPVGVGGHARVEGRRNEWGYNLIGEYAWPLFASGRAWPLLEQQLDVHMEKEEDRIAAETKDPEEQRRLADDLRNELCNSIDRGEPSPFLLGSVEGPVSVNPVGVYEGLFTYGFFPPRSPQSRWASFNVGELLWPQSRWSLLPLLLVSGGLSFLAIRRARREDGDSRDRAAASAVAPHSMAL